MGRQRCQRKLEDRQSPSVGRHGPTPQTDSHEQRPTLLEPLAHAVLTLQRTAGNAAVATVLGGRGAVDATRAIVQRQPKGKQPRQPQWVKDAQAVFTKEFPTLKGVVIKNFADLNKTLQQSHFAGWTQSKTEIYIKDPSKPADPKEPAPSKAQQAMFVRYILEHEAEHVRQFINPGGPPTKWEQMLLFEKAAYEKDRLWLKGAGANIITDEGVFDTIEEAADKNVMDITAMLDAAKTLTGAAREKALYQAMMSKKLIPAGADPDPAKLYKQPAP
jgi:hypothetical protein